jgi:integrase
MIQIDLKKLETALLQPGTLMFAELITRITSDMSLPPTRRRDMVSGLRRVANAVGRAPEDVPADAHWLQKRLADFLPASIGLTPKSWSNILSNARAALAQCGVVKRRINRTTDLSPAWAQLWDRTRALGNRTVSSSAGRFVYFLNSLGVAPEDVRFEHAEAFRDALIQFELRKSPDDSFRKAVNSWNLAVRLIPEWPRQTFVLPSRAKVIKLKPEAFPLTFVADLEAYLAGLRDPDVFDPEALAVPLRPASINQYRGMLLRFASILVLTGLPAEEISDLSVLVNLRNAEDGLRWMRERTNNQNTVGLAATVNLLRNLARRHVKVAEAHQKRLDYWNDRFAVTKSSGMTVKNRDRLRPLQDQTTLHRLLVLPEQLFDRGFPNSDSKQAVLGQEDALAIAILQYCPIRRKNLFSIHLDHNLHRPADGRVFLVFEEDEVKNARRIEFELPGHVAGMIDRHLQTRSPRLCPAGTPWLFPLRDGSGPASANYFCTKVKHRIQKEIGLTINMHLFRHIAAQIWLHSHPGQYEVVKRLLGHSALSQTLNVYAGFEAGTSARLFAEVIEAARRK